MNVTKRVFIIHGWEATPEIHWFPWLKRQLEEHGFEAAVPAMPHTLLPKLQQWLEHLKQAAGEVDENTYMVGHSLGVITILKFLEDLPGDQIIGGAVLVAGFPQSLGIIQIESFTRKSLNYEKVKRSAGKFVAIHSDNDPYVPLVNGEILRDRLGAELIVVPGAGHFNTADGFTKLPIVLEALTKMAE